MSDQRMGAKGLRYGHEVRRAERLRAQSVELDRSLHCPGRLARRAAEDPIGLLARHGAERNGKLQRALVGF